MNEVYLISGLGADRRVFDFLDFSGFVVHHVEWIQPQPNESLSSYAARLKDQIRSSNPIIVGVSFGGMLAIEIGKLLSTKKIILISSARTYLQIPWYFRMFGRLGVNRLIPTRVLKAHNEITDWFFGVTAQDHRRQLHDILLSTDLVFLRWALGSILTWRNVVMLSNVFQIHGSRDRLLPVTSVDFCVDGGGHLMVITHAPEISRTMRQQLN